MIHRRHIQREVVAASLLILAGFIALFGFFDLLGELRDVGKGSYRLTQAVLYTVLRASGLSTWRLLMVLFRAAAWFALAAFLIGEVVAPASEQAAKTLRVKAISGVVAQDFSSGLWVKDDNNFINVGEMLQIDTRDGRFIKRM